MPTYRAKLTVITPVHIGSGEELRQGFEYVVHQGKTWRLNVERIVEARFERWQRMAAAGHAPPPARLLDEADFRRGDFFRYVLPGVPQSPKTYAALREFIKDPWDRPYITGSSLKGAIRTALAWTGWDEAQVELGDLQDFQKYDPRKKRWEPHPRPGDRFERQIFQPGNQRKYPDQLHPNYDLLRALQVSDFFGPKKPGEGLVVFNAQVVTRRGFQAPIPLEALRGNVSFEGTIKIDDYLLGPKAAELRFGDRVRWLSIDELLKRLRTYSRARLEHLAAQLEANFGHLPGAAGVAANLRKKLLALPLPKNMVLLHLGWGTGWDGKTFWTHLQSDAHLFEELIRLFDLQRRKGAPPRKPGDPFPASRRMAIEKDQIMAPFGWVLLEIL